ncbi:YbaB/EbfC family nucleoid-associated protein [Goodfellowiella coeruleoviolacea]|uniref:YbaB/EbfC DNA-binding family protein n=1 Tax=Goodfellowiella coeruleoviolacea TaxID=334858 RepID=A0AAE3GCC0_9PSEU|nr:YbaB/EbfC family nucleoid-associated protein [Goodfellowiella coeruleoviolacea]MCP2165505.1 YbaB/EbfC DNA-binding family protein [Goodfellowiella coeruleoviolacea]
MDPLGANPMKDVDPEQWLRDITARMSDLQQKAEELQANFATAGATVSSKDNHVTVTIAPTGALQNLRLGPNATTTMSPQQLAATIMETVHKAQRRAAGNVVTAFEPLGVGTQTMDLVTSYLPPEQDEDQERWERDNDAYAVEDTPDRAGTPPTPPQRPYGHPGAPQHPYGQPAPYQQPYPYGGQPPAPQPPQHPYGQPGAVPPQPGATGPALPPFPPGRPPQQIRPTRPARPPVADDEDDEDLPW